MITENSNVCCICCQPVSRGNVYYCSACYKEYKDEIRGRNKPKWLRYVLEWERQRRRKRNKQREAGFLPMLRLEV